MSRRQDDKYLDENYMASKCISEIARLIDVKDDLQAQNTALTAEVEKLNNIVIQANAFKDLSLSTRNSPDTFIVMNTLFNSLETLNNQKESNKLDL